MGEVFRARDERLGRVVAVKILHSELAERGDLRHRFEREAKMLARLNHPHICTLHDLGDEGGVEFLVLEYLEGQSLASRLHSSRLPIQTGIVYAQQMAEALSAAHRIGLVHRDLKPTNVFVTRGGTKLLDFGIARSIPVAARRAAGQPEGTTHTATDTGAILGSPGYIAPEVLEGLPADARSDLFSFGAVLFQMFAGRPAFKASNPAELIASVLREEVPLLSTLIPEIPHDLEALVANCLVKDPEARWQNAYDAFLELRRMSEPSEPRTPRTVVCPSVVDRLTFNRGTIYAARFVPDGREIIYTAAWEGAPMELYLTRRDSPESRPLGFGRAELLSVSRAGQLALSLERQVAGLARTGVLAQVPFAGTEPRRLLEDVLYADWIPDGQRLVVVRRVGLRCQLEWPMGHVVHVTDGLISHPRVSPDGRFVAFLDHPHSLDDAGAVAVSEGGTSTRVLSDGWSNVWGLAWSPRGDEVWFTAAKRGTARALRGVTLSGQERLIVRSTTALTLHDVAHDGSVLISHETQRNTALFRGDEERYERNLSYLDCTVPRDLSADGRMMLFDETGDGEVPEYGVYLRQTSGGPPVRLGNGLGRTISPDQRWVITLDRSLQGITVLPTAVGDSFTIQDPELHEHRAANWLSDGRHVVFSAAKRGSGQQLFLYSLDSGKTCPLSSEGIIGPAAVAPDGQRVVAVRVEDRSTWLFALEAAIPPTRLEQVPCTDIAIQWSADGRALYLRRRGGELPLRIYRFSLETGEKELWKEITISDRAGVEVIPTILLTPDGRHYVIPYPRVLSDLFLMSALG
jgi:Tol biopolymer transport system component